MKVIEYSIICEDNTQKLYVQNFIKRFETDNLVFSFNELFFKQFKCSNSKDVLKKYVQAVDYTFLRQYYLDLLFIGIDYDDRPRNNFRSEHQSLYAKISELGKNKTVILFPVQAIEHWLLFVQHKTNNSVLTKNIAGQIEKINRRAKELLYTDIKDKDDYIISLIKGTDYEWLRNQSISFNTFFEQVVRFIK